MADTHDVDRAARALVAAVFQELRNHERAVRLRPSKWMDLLTFGGQSVMGLAEFQKLEAALKATFPERFEGPLGTHELTSQYAFALLDGAVLRAGFRHMEFEPRPADLGASVGEMLDLARRDHDRSIGARVVTDIEVKAPFYAGSVELRPVGSWGLNDAYRDINGLIPGAGPMLDEDIRFRVGGSFTYTTLTTATEAPIGDRIDTGYAAASKAALARLETVTSALRLATGSTSQSVVDVTSAPGHVRFYRPEIFRHDIDHMELVQRIGHIGAELGTPIAELGDRMTAWGGDDQNPHSLGVALSRFGRSYETRPWFDMLVDVAVGLEAALLGGSEQEEIGLKLRSRAAALLATATDPAATVYADIKRLYSLRSMIVHGSSPTTKDLEAQAYKISATQRTTWRGVKWALALDRARDLLRRAILARGFLLDAELWPSGKRARAFDVDAQLVDPVGCEEWRQTWRRGLEVIGLASAADEAPPASLEIALPDHSYGHGEPPPAVKGDPSET